MFHIYLTLAYLYVLWRFVIPLPLSRSWRTLLALALLLISKYHLILIMVYGTMFSPEVPRLYVLIAGWLFCAFVLILVFTLLVDLVCSVVAIRRNVSSKNLFCGRLSTGIAAFALLLSAVCVYQAVQVPGVRRVEVSVENLPQSFDGLRIVQLTDLHISRLFPASWVERLVSSTNRLNPDAIMITGDLIDGTVQARMKDVAPLSKLKAPLGVIAVPGNHEYYFDADQWIAEYRRLGMLVLVNEHLALQRGTGNLIVAGVTDEVAPKFGLPGPDLQQALSGSPKDTPTILLKHRPFGAAQSAVAGVSVQLSGHTHGGMIRGLDQVARYANQGFISGRYDVDGMTLYVSNGTALWNGFPIRLGVPAEITEIVLRADRHTPQVSK
ncbi:metallophosphoesterase [Pseudomonas amygdali pv. tabaci str. ATCC 11528]|uniref:metallophosphoesterase n=1 Tax=Pseudomonas amygdali TaxID=47877 RepID=UPI0001BC9A34|nr:metallophosphoesterase [Pseudomonas amygdali]KEZ67865.1 metallophosphoesterase [Pseudomonas amygdali pv. tabaci str. ATCC 11528]KKY51316.1 metallophosphoesterase [Pseudomonas amygdali pv. tabaci str. ATCC 11528]QED84808.1 metallophosphoesterase [Pseudomonas amygdali pv. tabaci str. ATCC 11528]